MVKSCTVFSEIKLADGYDRFIPSVLASYNSEPGRAGSPPLYLRCVTLVWMGKPLDQCGRPPCPWCVGTCSDCRPQAYYCNVGARDFSRWCCFHCRTARRTDLQHGIGGSPSAHCARFQRSLCLFGWSSLKFDIYNIFRKSVEKIKILLKSNKNNEYFIHEDQNTFLIYLTQSFLE